MFYKRLDFRNEVLNFKVGNQREFLELKYDPRCQCYEIKRDLIGVIPCYVAKDPAGDWHISSTMQSLRPYFGSINKNWLRQIKKFNFSDQIQTAFKNIWRIPPGSTAILDGHSIQIPHTTEIFDLEHFDSNCSEDTWLQFGDELLNKAVTIRSQKSALFCSGGLDSNLLSQKVSNDTHLLCLDFQSEPERDTRGLQNLLRLHPERVELYTVESFPQSEFKYKAKRDPAIIAYSPNLWLFRPLLKRAKQLGCQQVFTGLGGDDLFEPSGDIRTNLNYRFFYSGLYSFAIEQEQELAQSYGLLMSYPLLDIELIKYILSTPKKLIRSQSINKILLRKIAHLSNPGSDFNYISQQDYTYWRERVANRQRSRESFDEWIAKHYTDLCEQQPQEIKSYDEKEKALQKAPGEENRQPPRPQPNH